MAFPSYLKNSNTTLPGSQRGAVLILSLILLALVTMITLSSVKSTVMDERMAGNLRDKNIAFQAAEAALREAEDVLDNNVLPAFDGNTPGYYPLKIKGGILAFWQAYDWETKSVEYSNTVPLSSNRPRYVIEELAPVPLAGGSKKFGPVNGNMVYRVTALGYGGNAQTNVIVQSTFRR